MTLRLGSFVSDVRSVVLTGLSTASSAVLTATDSVLVALGKLQAQITALTSQGRVRVTVKQFGAVGDGTNDDTAAIVAAIASLPAAGGEVFFPAGTYRISSVVNVSAPNVRLIGAGTHATIIFQAVTTAGVLNISGSDAQAEHMLLGYFDGTTPGTSTIALDTSSANGRYSHLSFYNVAHAIHVTGQGTGQFFQFITVQGATGSCLWADNTSDTQITNFMFLPGGVDSAGATKTTGGAFRVSGWVEALVAQSGEIYGGLYCLAMSGTALSRGSCPAFCNFNDVYFDSSASFALNLANVMDIEFVGCWVAGGRVAGAAQPGGNLGNTSGVRFTNTKFIANGSHGLVLNTGAVNTTVLGCTFDSNGGNVTAGTAAGIAVVPGVSKFVIANSRFSNGIIPAPTGGVQQNGVLIQAGSSNHYRIEGNIFDSSLGGEGIVDGGTGTDKQVETALGNRGALIATDLTLTTDASQTALSGAWTQITPTIAPATGTFTTAGATLRYKKIGRTLVFSLHGLITTPGTGAGGVNITMPFAPAWDSCFAGRETAVSGKAVTGELFISSTTLSVNNYDNSSMIAANAAFTINGVYETTT